MYLGEIIIVSEGIILIISWQPTYLHLNKN